MTQDMLKKKVWDLAHIRVNKKIDVFKERLRLAMQELGATIYDPKISKEVVTAGVLAAAGYQAEWPRFLWDNEASAVMNEVLDTMDTCQRMLQSPDAGENFITEGKVLTEEPQPVEVSK